MARESEIENAIANAAIIAHCVRAMDVASVPNIVRATDWNAKRSTPIPTCTRFVTTFRQVKTKRYLPHAT